MINKAFVSLMGWICIPLGISALLLVELVEPRQHIPTNEIVEQYIKCVDAGEIPVQSRIDLSIKCKTLRMDFKNEDTETD